jgi:hypothetical protein
MAPKPPIPYKINKRKYTLYIARDHTQSGAQVIKFGLTETMPKKRLQAIRGGFGELIGEMGFQLTGSNAVTKLYGYREDWVMERVWSFNSDRAAEEAEKLSVALALSYSGTLPIGQDYVSDLDLKAAKRAVANAIQRVRYSAGREGFKLEANSNSRRQSSRAEAGHDWVQAPEKPPIG